MILLSCGCCTVVLCKTLQKPFFGTVDRVRRRWGDNHFWRNGLFFNGIHGIGDRSASVNLSLARNSTSSFAPIIRPAES